MSILLLPASRVTSAFYFGVIASEISACDNLLFLGDFGHPFFVIIIVPIYDWAVHDDFTCTAMVRK